MRKVIITTVITGLIGLGGVAVPMAAFAATGPPAGTAATLGVTGGDLDITAQTNADLGSVAAGATTTSGDLGTVTVADGRATDGGSWTASAVTSDFKTLITAGPVETIPATDLTYTPGDVTATAGTITPTAGAAGAAMSTDTGVTAYSAAGEVGVTSLSWDPTVGFNLPTDVVVGNYSGTITHSVA